MKPTDLIDKLASEGVKLSLNIHVDAPAGVDVVALAATTREHKPAILTALAGQWMEPVPPTTAVDHAEVFADLRTATIAEVNGSLTRADVPDGWDRGRWVERLRYLAGVCTNPTRVTELQAWADRVEASNGSTQ